MAAPEREEADERVAQDRLAPPSASSAYAFLLDVDGTLIEFAQTPDEVQLDLRLLGLMECLFRASGGATALISGRSIADLDRRIRRPDLPIAGQHGLERRDASGATTRLAARGQSLAAMSARLRELVAIDPALLLEDKGLAVALHYRRAPALASYLEARVRELMAAMPGLEIYVGKQVIEVKPAGIDKGTAISAYLDEAPFRGRVPVFIGDDVTDERGFAIVNAAAGLSIKVGAGASCARYRLPNVAAVRAWLSHAAEEACK